MKRLFLALAIFAGCTPGLKVGRDAYTGWTWVVQPPALVGVTAEHKLHYLGFEWTPARPDTVVLVAQIGDIANIDAIGFGVSGERIESARPIASMTNFGSSSSRVSSRKFVISRGEFERIAASKVGVMRMGHIGSASQSQWNDGSPVTEKFGEFLAKMRETR